MKIAVLFDGAGLARLGLEEAGHDCTGFEIDPWKHYLSKMVGSGNCVCQDATTVDLTGFQGVWASPPCQSRSSATTRGTPRNQYAKDYVNWCLELSKFPLWIENVVGRTSGFHSATIWNAAQFSDPPRQNRNRAIGGNYRTPQPYFKYKKVFPGVCPTIMASESRGSPLSERFAAKFYGRKLTLEECSYHQGFEIPIDWYAVPDCFTDAQWLAVLYEAIGNGVPVYMVKAFGEAHVDGIY